MGIEPIPIAWQAIVRPLYYRHILVAGRRIELLSSAYETCILPLEEPALLISFKIVI